MSWYCRLAFLSGIRGDVGFDSRLEMAANTTKISSYFCVSKEITGQCFKMGNGHFHTILTFKVIVITHAAEKASLTL
jgi:hypothetical protein